MTARAVEPIQMRAKTEVESGVFAGRAAHPATGSGKVAG